MITLNETIQVHRSRTDCYRYLADFSTCEQWNPSVYRAAKRTPGAARIGTEFDVMIEWLGRRRTLRYRITSLIPDTRIELSGAGRDMQSTETIRLHTAEDGTTRIDYHADFELAGALRWSAPVARPVFKRMGAHAVEGLRQALEIDPEPPRQGWLSYIADRSLLAAAPALTARGYRALENKSHSEFMDGRVVIITGATRGIGAAAACEYARLGATVALVGREPARLEASAQQVRDFAGCDAERIACFEADLLDMAEARALASRLSAAYPRIDVLVNNAGALFDTHERTRDGFERTLAINLIAPFALTEALMEPLTAAAGRVINMSSGGMVLQPLVLTDMNSEHGTFDGLKAYARSKRSLVALTRHWARRYADTGVRFNAMHPGWVATPGVKQSLPGFNRVMGRVLRDTRMGADTAVWLGASSAAGQCNGKFFFDRRPHPTDVLPGTALRPSQAQSLYGWLRNETGIQGHGFG